MGIEYRVCWTASSNIAFRGASDWDEWDDDDTADVVERHLSRGTLTIEGLEYALEASGFEWHVETRESGS